MRWEAIVGEVMRELDGRQTRVPPMRLVVRAKNGPLHQCWWAVEEMRILVDEI